MAILYCFIMTYVLRKFVKNFLFLLNLRINRIIYGPVERLTDAKQTQTYLNLDGRISYTPRV